MSDMKRFTRLTSAGIDMASQLLLSPLFAGGRLASRKKARRALRRARLQLDRLEDRTLLAATISGNVFNDLNNSGSRAGGDPALAGQTVFLDLNHNHTLDNSVSTFAAPSVTLSPSPIFSTDRVATQTVSALPAQVVKVSVTLDVSSTNADDLKVILVGPQFSTNVPTGATLISLFQGEHFTGTIDEQANTPVALASSPFGGSYQPEQPFTLPTSHVYDGNPNGQWGLLFQDIQGSDVTGVTLNSWSLNFTLAETNTVTDASGNYSFTGLSAGTYSVGIVPSAGGVVTSPGGGAVTQDVTVAANQVVNGIDFGVHAAPDLVGTSFQVVGTNPTWGSTVQVNYTVTNQGAGDAGPFKAELHLANDGTIGGSSDVVLQTVSFASGLAHGASSSGALNITLPSTPPSGFQGDPLDNVFLGFVIDPSNSVTESDKTNNSNQGNGLDLAPLTVTTDTAVTNDSAVQQMPSVAVDPNDPNHVATAYMDYGLQSDGYAGIGISVSHDGGTTWTRSSVPLPANFNQAAGQPVVRFDDKGHVFVAYMAATFFGNKPPLIYDTGTDPVTKQAYRTYDMQANNGIFVVQGTESTPGTLVWQTPVAVASQRYDLTTTTSPTGVAPGTATITPAVMDPNMLKNANVIIDQGLPDEEKVKITAVTATTFTAVFTKAHAAGFTIRTPVYFEATPDLAIDTNKTLPGGSANPNYGNLYVTWTRFYPQALFPNKPTGTAGSDIMFAVSKDGGNPANRGQSWTTQLQTAGSTKVSTIRDPLVGTSATGTEGTGKSTISHVTVGPEGDVYVTMFAGGRFPVFHSTDAGAHFSTPDPFVTHGYPFGTELDIPDGVPVTFPVPNATLFNDNFRVQSVRAIAADPAHPGRVYAVETVQIKDINNNLIDAGEINFARSDDYGATWVNIFTVGPNTLDTSNIAAQYLARFRPALNDDDGTKLLIFNTSLTNDIISGQVMPALSVDSHGNIVVIWYDTRRDPAGQKLDVFGTVSKDGGHTFTSNFALTDAPFDPNAGTFTDARGGTNYFLGDLIGVAATTNGTAYATWTGVDSAGGQDIYFKRFSVLAPPTALNDRFEPNDTPQTATSLGTVVAQQVVPRLSLTAGDNDWFLVQAGATGSLIISASATAGGSSLQLELWESTGANLLATGTAITDQSGNVIGEQISYQSNSGQKFLIHVKGGVVPTYSLVMQSLTADLGTSVEGSASGTITSGGQSVYRLVAATSGSIDLTLTPAATFTGTMTLKFLSADGQTVLASTQTTGSAAVHLSLAVTQGQVVLIEVIGGTGAAGNYQLDYTNADQFETSQNSSLFFPTTGAPSGIAAGDLNGDGNSDLVVTSNQFTNSANVLLGNGNGTFQAARQYDVGPGTVPIAVRPPILADLNHDGILDMIIPNYSGADVSVLLGRGDGTFAPEIRFDATFQPDSVAVGDFNGDGILDLAVLGRVAGQAKLAILLGRGDGTFLPPQIMTIPFDRGAFPVVAGDLNGDGKTDLIVFGANAASFQVLLGNGDGTFTPGGIFSSGEVMNNALLVDVNGDKMLDLVVGGNNSGNVYVILGNGDGTFQAPVAYSTGLVKAGDNVAVIGLAVTDFGSGVLQSNGTTTLGAADGKLDIVATIQSILGTSAPQLVMLPGIAPDAQGHLFGAPIRLATLNKAGQVVAADFNKDGATDLAVTDTGGVRVVYGKPPTIAANTTQATARNLGTVVHYEGPTLSLIPGFQDAYYTMTVPTEAAQGSGAEVIDFSAGFQNVTGGNLVMEVHAADGTLLGSGDRFRVVAPQGAVLTVHLYAVTGTGGARGSGTYTLDIDVLPQIVSVQAQSALPGGSATSLVVTLQGDRIDPAAAQNPANYVVTWFGPDGVLGTADDQIIPVAATTQPIVYNPDANVQVASGRTYPSAVRQTITLLFDQPLPAGSYAIALSPNIRAASFNAGEAGLLTANTALGGHELVTAAGGKIANGGSFVATNLVTASTSPGDPDAIANGTPFLTQLQNDLGALLDAALNAKGDDPAITAALNAQIQARFASAFSSADSAGLSFVIFWLDPVSIDLETPQQGQQVNYDLKTNQATNTADRTYVEVGGNVEVIVVAGVAGTFKLNVGDVPGEARGGAVVLTPGGNQLISFTDAMRGGTTEFVVNVAEGAGAALNGAINTTLASLGTPAGTPFSTETTSVLSSLAEPGAALSNAVTAQASNLAQAATEALVVTVVLGLTNGSPAAAPVTEATNTSAAFSVLTSAPTASGVVVPESGDLVAEVQNAVDGFFLWLRDSGEAVATAAQPYAVTVEAIVEKTASPVTKMLWTMGGGEMAQVDIPWRAFVKVFNESADMTAELFRKNIRFWPQRVTAPTGPGSPAATGVPAARAGEEDETEAQVWDPDFMPAQENQSWEAGAIWPALFFATGAIHAWLRDTDPDDDASRKKPRVAWKM
jgi:hypothetical protein